ncbi:hypothetical protein R6G85_01710 [Actinotignum urinale]|uniref:Uncharacterized protein n=1 Tax=Actinotignum urinale TaxID=190146 RepID=A0ABU5G682_9ACTO|nr:hypothetical protein [Actinotignum urinale]MDY5128458.1 hypothetical protein [Actinotignum urinale]MDY5132707.1 hypothetical protein [Actinotignum urinale]MDY5151204.1 hypothetical protein [Actinotignum urinale]WIK59584.1 hypothetical protein CJ184_002770 [Actinotignum urinale]
MYGALWRALPGPKWLKVIEAIIIFLIIVAILFTWVFPWIAETTEIMKPDIRA